MKKITSRLLSALLALCMVLALLPFAALAAEPKVEGLGVASRTIEEIRAFIAEHPATLDDPLTYKTEPSLSEPYSPGVLSDETATSALNMINQVRYIAGLRADVTLDENYSYLASAASLLNCLNSQMSHYPSRPDVLAGAAYDKLYSDGGTGARRGNLAYGYRNLNDTIIRGWCADDGQFEVGHRRWILNPTMGKTGFGAAGIHSTMYAHDTSGKGGEYNVAWPAQMMPVEYFSSEYPWSLSVGTSVNANDVSVKMVRRSDNKTWNFKKVDSEDVILFDDIFYVNNGGYGAPGNISFQTLFDPEVRNGAIYDITVTIGSREIRYSVNFFSLESDTVDTMYPVTGGSIFFDSKTGTVTGCDSGVTEAVIPSEIGGIPVTGIGRRAFDCYGLTSVTIPDTVTTIGEGAFYYCENLTDVYYGGSESQWKQIDIASTSLWGGTENGNAPLLSAKIHYNSPMPGTPDTPDTPDNPPTFTDVPAGAYYAEAVNWAVEKEITDGIGGNEFGSTNIVSRAQAVTFLWRAAGRPEPKSLTSRFADVTDPNQWYYKAVLWAAEQEITDGTGYGMFGINDTLPYDQMLTFMCRAAGVDTSGDWSGKAIRWAESNGLTNGLTYSAYDDCPRCDVVYILWKQLA